MITEPGHLNWGGEGLWQALEPLLPGSPWRSSPAPTRPTRSCWSARACPEGGATSHQPADAAEPVGPSSLTAEEPTPFGRRAGDTQPCLLVAEHQTRGRGRHGRLWQGSAGASLTFSLALALDPPDWSGLSLRWAWRWLKPSSRCRRAAEDRHQVAERPVAARRAGRGTQAGRRADRDGGGRQPAHGGGRRRA
jgi:BirA family biotin operon repressor/biotin-[acetyl-CoA-carboxylase] ligase